MPSEDTLKLQAEPGKLQILRGKTFIVIEPAEVDDLIGKLSEARAIAKIPTSPAVWEIGKVSKTSAADAVK